MGREPREPAVPPFTPTSGTLVRECADRWGDRPFVTLGDRRITYREADRGSARLAVGLLRSGVGKGTRVGLLGPNSPEWVLIWLAATRIGAVLATLNTYEKAPGLHRTIRHADLHTLLVAGRVLGVDELDRLEESVHGLADATHEQILSNAAPYLRTVWTWGAPSRRWCGELAQLAARAEGVDEELLVEVEAEVHPSDPMMIVYSSGSTADPKGAVHTHGAVVRHAYNLDQDRDLRGDDVIYTPMPLFWVGGFSYTLVAAMHVGASLVFEERFEPGATLELLERERVTQVLGWPHMAAALAEHPDFARRNLSSIRAGTMAALLPQDRQVDASVPKATSLGMTETLGPHTFPSGDPESTDADGTFGRSVPGVEHRVVDPFTSEDVPTGVTGELWVRGYSVMVGLNKRERCDTFTADGWYRTGDSGWFDPDGNLHFVGRMGELIKTSGMNVMPREVELALEELPEVDVAFVTGAAHHDRGQDVVAAIALRPGRELDEEAARARVKAQLPSYMVPRRIAVFVDQSELPWRDSGKIDRRRLAAILAERFGSGDPATPRSS